MVLVGIKELLAKLLLEGAPTRLLLGEAEGVALFTFDDCDGDTVLVWCTDEEDLFGVLPGVATDICDGTLEGPDCWFAFSEDEIVVAEFLQGDGFCPID